MVTHIKTIIDRVTFWADLTTKTSKTNGFDTIEIDLVSQIVTNFHFKPFLGVTSPQRQAWRILNGIHHLILTLLRQCKDIQ